MSWNEAYAYFLLTVVVGVIFFMGYYMQKSSLNIKDR